jgi:hypothetical protein
MQKLLPIVRDFAQKFDFAGPSIIKDSHWTSTGCKLVVATVKVASAITSLKLDNLVDGFEDFCKEAKTIIDAKEAGTQVCKNGIVKKFTPKWLKRTLRFLGNIPGYLMRSLRSQTHNFFYQDKISEEDQKAVFKAMEEFSDMLDIYERKLFTCQDHLCMVKRDLLVRFQHNVNNFIAEMNSDKKGRLDSLHTKCQNKFKNQALVKAYYKVEGRGLAQLRFSLDEVTIPSNVQTYRRLKMLIRELEESGFSKLPEPQCIERRGPKKTSRRSKRLAAVQEIN